jgi:CheY-like chemotaxis protein
LDGIVGIIGARAAAKQLRLTFDARTSLPDMILADETRLRQVLLNLLGNAVKFTKHGGVTFRVSCCDEEPVASDETQPGAHVTRHMSRITFDVIDTGVGIAPDDLPRLFRPFEQIGAAWQRAEGTGLGLAISQHLVQRMGSAIQVESQFGGGVAFWFDLVVPVLADAPVTNAPADRPIIGYTGPRRTILVADDNPYNRALLVDLLRPLGFVTLEAADGLSVLEQAQAMRPDAILMDLLMPGMTGADATQAIRRIDALKDTVIIATSASVFDSDRQQSLLAGCTDFLPKPIQVDRLLALLMTHLNLTWRYAEAEPILDARAAGTDQVALLPPPPEELLTLFELATIGDLLGLQKRAIYLEQQNAQLGPFARRLRHLASRFEPEQMLALIAQYLPPEA